MASGLAPLDFLLEVMRDEKAELHVRLDAAKSAANYVHPKLSAIEHSGPEKGPLEVQTSQRMTPPEVAQAIGKMIAEAEAAVGLSVSKGPTRERLKRVLNTGEPVPPSLYAAIQHRKGTENGVT
ncbi:MAG: hypothetical protein WBD95_01960 [Xanthobacteraceae bacterium]